MPWRVALGFGGGSTLSSMVGLFLFLPGSYCSLDPTADGRCEGTGRNRAQAPGDEEDRILSTPPMWADDWEMIVVLNKWYPNAKLINPGGLDLMDLALLFNIPPRYILAQIKRESSFNPKNPDSIPYGTYGLFQLSKDTAGDMKLKLSDYAASLSDSPRKLMLLKLIDDMKKNPNAWQTDPTHNMALGITYLAWARDDVVGVLYPGLSDELYLTMALARYNKGNLAEQALSVCIKKDNGCEKKIGAP
jgi:hypothetical protein